MANSVPRSRAHRADADAERARQADRRLHACAAPAGAGLPHLHLCGGKLLPALVRARIAAGRRQLARRAPWTTAGSRLPAHARARCCRNWCAKTCRARRFRSCRSASMDVGMIPALVGRVSLHRRPGYEIWVTSGLSARAVRAAERRGPRAWLAAVRRARPELACASRRASEPGRANTGRSTGPYEAGLGRFVDLNKGDFVGREAALQEKASGGCAAARDLRRGCRGCRCDLAMSRSGTTARWSAG